MENHIVELIPEYVLNSLDREQRLLVDRHVSTCESCKAELRAYSEVIGELPYAVSLVEPPPELKRQIMQKIRSGNQLRREDPALSVWQKILNFSKVISPAWTVASLLLIVVLGAGNLIMMNQLRDSDQAQGATNLSVINLNGTGSTPDAIGLIVLSKDGEHGTLIVDRLPPLDEAHQYQLWLIRDGERTSGGMLSVSRDGYGSLWVGTSAPLNSFNSFGITIEPFGGSPAPTGEKVLGSGT
jgi:anti-sigma-K factor RskA